jgi:hypothetical protein
MTVMMTSTCEILTRKSRLTYQTSTLPDGKVYLRIHRKSRNGFFSNEWVFLQDIRKPIGEIPAGKPVTAIALVPLFTDRSVNTPALLLAALAELRLLVPMNGNKQSHEPVSSEESRERVRRQVQAARKKAEMKKKARASSKNEPPRVFRKPVSLSQAAMADSSSWR